MSDEGDRDLFEQALQIELIKRIDAVSSYTDQDFGVISRVEWVVFLIMGLVVPSICVWWVA